MLPLLMGAAFVAGTKKAKENPYMTQGNAMGMGAAQSFNNFANAGPGQQDVSNYTGGQRDLASMLQQYSQGGFMPGQQDISKANDFAGQMFQAQRTQQTQAFQDQLTQANRQAALSGRGVNDPILRAKLAQEQTRQGAMLDSQQGAYAAQYAQSMPGQRLQYAQQRVGVLGDMSNQAWNNQQQRFNMGNAIKGFQDQNRGGGLMGGVNSAMKIGGEGMKIAGSMAGMMMGNPMAAGGMASSFKMPEMGSSAGFGGGGGWNLGGGGGIDLTGANPYSNPGASAGGGMTQPAFGSALQARPMFAQGGFGGYGNY